MIVSMALLVRLVNVPVLEPNKIPRLLNGSRILAMDSALAESRLLDSETWLYKIS